MAQVIQVFSGEPTSFVLIKWTPCDWTQERKGITCWTTLLVGKSYFAFCVYFPFSCVKPAFLFWLYDWRLDLGNTAIVRWHFLCFSGTVSQRASTISAISLKTVLRSQTWMAATQFPMVFTLLKKNTILCTGTFLRREGVYFPLMSRRIMMGLMWEDSVAWRMIRWSGKIRFRGQ